MPTIKQKRRVKVLQVARSQIAETFRNLQRAEDNAEWERHISVILHALSMADDTIKNKLAFLSK